MKDSKLVHIGHFILVFQYNKATDTINFDDFTTMTIFTGSEVISRNEL